MCLLVGGMFVCLTALIESQATSQSVYLSIHTATHDTVQKLFASFPTSLSEATTK
jgi:hypothetical protein